jgi:hypothetical protein
MIVVFSRRNRPQALTFYMRRPSPSRQSALQGRLNPGLANQKQNYVTRIFNRINTLRTLLTFYNLETPNSFNLNDLRTLAKTPWGIPPSSRFGTPANAEAAHP